MTNRVQPKSISIYDLVEGWSKGNGMSLRSCDMPSWEIIRIFLPWEHYPLGGGYFSAKDHGSSGVYLLIGLDADDDLSKPSTFNRICGQDRTGTLYIGEASDLARRLNQLRRSAALRTERSHRAIQSLQSIWRLNYPIARLAVAFIRTGNNTRWIERDLILAYINTFGDTPPLNYRFSL
ncbi:hypothetical protein [Bradyrhizobium sp. Bra64]|uniref:hypothetical protein n=1 Tax=Bradyrhizobium sp. Bra64 TaxID=2926009 RepID=UPI0021198C64|nr:hypothetical protein [Bradyrhizobium sp. Bra64]